MGNEHFRINLGEIHKSSEIVSWEPVMNHITKLALILYANTYAAAGLIT